jgi:hypothetical protein
MFPPVRRWYSRPAPVTYKFSDEGKGWNGVSQEQQVQTAFNVLILEFGGTTAFAWILLALTHSSLNPSRQEGAHDLTHKSNTPHSAITPPPTAAIWNFFILLFLLAIRKHTFYKLMWWLHKVHYDTTVTLQNYLRKNNFYSLNEYFDFKQN